MPASSPAPAGELDIGRSTVQRIGNQYHDGGIKRALFDLPRSGQPPKITDRGEAHLIALATSAPPEGTARWMLEIDLSPNNLTWLM